MCVSLRVSAGRGTDVRGLSGMTENSCEALCRSLVANNGLQSESTDISQSVLYTSLMGLLLVADKKVSAQRLG